MNSPRDTRPDRQGRLAAPYSLVIASFFALTAILYVFGDYGAAQDRENQRVLAEIDLPMQQAIAWAGQQRIAIYRDLGRLVAGFSVWCAFLFGVAVLTSRRANIPTGLGLSALCVGLWGQSLIFQGQGTVGWAVLGLAFALAFASGAFGPTDRAPNVPDSGATGSAAAPAHSVEFAILFAVLLATVVVRTYALTELRSGFDGESVHEMNMSRTAYGLRHYLSYSFIANASGLIQLLPQSLSFQLFGTSIFSERFSAVIVGSFVVLLSYFFVRRIAGVWPALMAAALLCLAPEQLFWSRSEVTQFASVLLVALVIIHLSFAMARNLSLPLTLATALAMPLSRLVYTPGWAMVALPWALAGHTLVFGRARRLKALYVIPLLVLGTALWAYSPSLLRWTFLDADARFVPPIEVYGHSFVRRSGELSTLETTDLVLAQVRGIAERTTVVAEHFFDDCNLITHWYSRSQVSHQHRTIANSALTIWAFCGLFYLLARLKDPRAFGVLAVTALAIAPTVMSPDPYPRRMLVVFLVLPIGAAVFAAALVRNTRRAGAVVASHLLAATAAAATLLIAAVQGSSYLQLPTAPSWLLEAHRFTRPLFAESDVVFHNLPYRALGNRAQLIAFGNLDDIVENGTAFEPVVSGHWVDMALHPTARYTNPVHDVIFSKSEREDLRQRNPLRKLTFLLEKSPKSGWAIEAIKAIYPEATSTEGAQLVALQTDAGDRAGRLTPDLLLSRGRSLRGAPPKLNGRPLRPRPTDSDVTVVAAGAFIENDTWLAWTMKPACPAATLTVDDRPVGWGETRPMLRGIHRLRLELPDACALPVALGQHGEGLPRDTPRLVAPRLTDAPALQPKPVQTYAGYSDATDLGRLPHQVADLTVDGDHLSVLGWSSRRAVVTRHDLDGQEIDRWDAGEDFPFAIAASVDGTHAILTHRKIKLYSRNGDLLVEANAPGVESNSSATFWGPDQLLVSSRQNSTLDIVNRKGQTVQKIKGLSGIDGRFGHLRSVASDGRGLVVVTDESNRAFVIRAAGAHFVPRRASHYRIDQAQRGTAIDDRGRILIPSQEGFQVYLADGTRLIAETPASDLASGRFGAFPIAAVRGREIYVLDKNRRSLTRANW